MELAKPFKMSQPAISKHLRVLGRRADFARSRCCSGVPVELKRSRLRKRTNGSSGYRELWEALTSKGSTFFWMNSQRNAAAKT